MGIEVNQTSFTQQESLAFKQRLEDNLSALSSLLSDSSFGIGPATIGAELEMYVIDERGQPLHRNQHIMDLSEDPLVTLELNRYNLEYNLAPCAIAGKPFSATEQELLRQLNRLNGFAAQLGGRVVPVGILPTLTDADLGPHCITDRKRYHALVAQLLKRRGSHFQIDINGADPLKLAMTDITLEGANTSFQIHYRVNPADYADMFNAVQMATPLIVALGANSPTLFGHALWHETRIPLFKQSIDIRIRDRYGWNEPPRVNFGRGWVRRSALELFAEAVRLYEPLLPICAESSAREQLEAGITPPLSELCLHQGTVWLWNRPVYDHADGGMLRIEMRSLPAGPTVVDMMANTAFLVGLAEGLRPYINQLLPALPFNTAEYNFYRAAQHGLNANIVWPQLRQYGPKQQSIIKVLEEMLPVAEQGLKSIGVDHAEISHYLTVIEQRIRHRQTGATWQLKKLKQLDHRLGKTEPLAHMLEEYILLGSQNIPVAQWPL